jgi:hypothetical protein
VRGERITEVAIELEPRAQAQLSLTRLRARLRHSVARVRRRLQRRPAPRSEPGVAREPEPGEREHEW